MLKMLEGRSTIIVASLVVSLIISFAFGFDPLLPLDEGEYVYVYLSIDLLFFSSSVGHPIRSHFIIYLINCACFVLIYL